MQDWAIIPRDMRDTLGEGTLWSARHGALFWVDILAPAINRLTLSSGQVDRWAMPEPIGWLVERRDGDLIAGLQSGFAEISLDPLTIRAVGNPEPHLPNSRMNDGKADALGNIWCGTMDMTGGPDCGSLYRLTLDLSWTIMDSGYHVPNGPAFSPDGDWLYHSDTGLRTVFRFRRHRDGTLSAREPFIHFEGDEGQPDGMTIDRDGGLWIAHWGGSCISRFTAEGKLDRRIALPARQITNITFGGEALDRMFVSSAAVGLEPSAEDGALFELFTGTVGLPTHLFAG